MKDGGGPAFPAQLDGFMGMSLRDWYAGISLQEIWPRGTCAADVNPNFKQIAADAYLMADAMLKARGQ